MAKPIPDLKSLSRLDKSLPGDAPVFRDSVDKYLAKSCNNNLILGTVTGWVSGVGLIRVGKLAAVGLGGGVLLLHGAHELGYIEARYLRAGTASDLDELSVDGSHRHFSSATRYGKVPPVTPQAPPVDVTDKPPDIPPPTEPFPPAEDSTLTPFPDQNKSASPFLPPKPTPVSHSPKISPSSIPNPSPSATTSKHAEPGYPLPLPHPHPHPHYGSFLYSIPGYSAFQPVPGAAAARAHSLHTAANTLLNQNDDNKAEFVPFPPKVVKETKDDKLEKDKVAKQIETPKTQTDFEEHFTPEIVPAVSEAKTATESKLNVSSLAQSSVATVTASNSVHDLKKKQAERFSLKTSIPISKIDMKCVTTAPDTLYHNSIIKKSSPTFNPAFQSLKDSSISHRVEIQSNIVIKNAEKTELDAKPVEPPPPTVTSVVTNSISTLINAAEAISSNETKFWKSEQKLETTEVKDTTFVKPLATTRPIYNPLNVEPRLNFNKTQEGFSEQKNQIVFIQNKNQSNQKMLLTISQQQPNSQVLLQRTSYESKNMQTPSHLSSLSKKCDDRNTSSKVVALKRLHQEDCDENDFENLITENQIYGNKIVVKEKAQGTSQEQDLKKNIRDLKTTNEKSNQMLDSKNLVLQSNFLYLSNLQFPANLMMIKNTTPDSIKSNNKCEDNEHKAVNENHIINANDGNSNTLKSVKNINVGVSKEVHIIKSGNNVIQTLTQTTNKTDLVFHSNQKVIMNPQILYQVPMIVDTDGLSSNVQKINAPGFINKDYTSFLTQNKKDITRTLETTKTNDKLYIACPYQMDSKLQPKIVITNLRPTITSKLEEVSTLDLYEKRKRLKRLKYLTNRDPKTDIKKEKSDLNKNIITPDKMKAEIYKEFTKTKITFEEGISSGSESDYEERELNEYNKIIDTYGFKDVRDHTNKKDFLLNFSLATHDECKEKLMDRQERSILKDSVAAAYIAADRIDRLHGASSSEESPTLSRVQYHSALRRERERDELWDGDSDGPVVQKKQAFLSKLHLVQVSSRYKEDYEKTWQQIVRERRRRNGCRVPTERAMATRPAERREHGLSTEDQLQILIEIKKSVNENNNLIKKRLDVSETHTVDDSIHMLAERNFSELSKLSKMADRSVKLFSGQDSGKRDVTPGFDSENMQQTNKTHQPPQSYPNINIPSISRIISLKSSQELSCVDTTPATSMDEPQSCAAGLRDDSLGTQADTTLIDNSEETSDQSKEYSWPGVEAVMKSYRKYDYDMRRKLSALQRRNLQLRAEAAGAAAAAGGGGDRARNLLAERQAVANEELAARASLQRLILAVEAVKNYQY